MKNIQGGNNSRLDEAEHQISDLEDKVAANRTAKRKDGF